MISKRRAIKRKLSLPPVPGSSPGPSKDNNDDESDDDEEVSVGGGHKMEGDFSLLIVCKVPLAFYRRRCSWPAVGQK